jgi:hypothetical protein
MIDWYTSSWLFVVYILGTYLGYKWGNRKVVTVIGETIESLRKGGYLKVKYSGKDDQEYEILPLEKKDG